MKIGDLVTAIGFGIGIIVDTYTDEDNGEAMFKVSFFNGFLDEWFYDGYLDALEVINESR